MQNSRITRPKVLLVVAHPTIGAALETLLGMEDRYEVVRVQSLELAERALRRWKPDAALVDGVLLQDGGIAAVSVPAFVLSGSAAEGPGLVRRLPDGRGWLRKDATPAELHAAIDSVIGAPRTPLSRSAVVAAALVALGAAGALGWLLLGAR